MILNCFKFCVLTVWAVTEVSCFTVGVIMLLSRTPESRLKLFNGERDIVIGRVGAVIALRLIKI
jgi:hypothetical protein